MFKNKYVTYNVRFTIRQIRQSPIGWALMLHLADFQCPVDSINIDINEQGTIIIFIKCNI